MGGLLFMCQSIVKNITNLHCINEEKICFLLGLFNWKMSWVYFVWRESFQAPLGLPSVPTTFFGRATASRAECQWILSFCLNGQANSAKKWQIPFCLFSIKKNSFAGREWKESVKISFGQCFAGFHPNNRQNGQGPMEMPMIFTGWPMKGRSSTQLGPKMCWKERKPC